MQDLKALEGKSLAELREIGKALGIPHLMMKKKDLIEKILNLVTQKNWKPVLTASKEAAFIIVIPCGADRREPSSRRIPCSARYCPKEHPLNF